MKKTFTWFIKKLVRIKRFCLFTIQNSVYYKLNRKNCKLHPVEQENINVCFFVQRSEIFTSVSSVFDLMCKDDRFKVSLMVLPRYDHGKRSLDIDSIKDNISFCNSLDGKFEVINSYNSEKEEFMDIPAGRFDAIFLGLPYGNQYPAKYSFEYLSSRGRLCYIPYGSSYADGFDMIRFGFPNDFLKHIDYIFSDCDKVYRYTKRKLRLCKNRDSKSIVYNVGYPRFDLIERNCSTGTVKNFLWLPRWTTDSDDNEKSTFLEYKDLLLNYFIEHPELNLIIRPHPLMFDHYVSKGILSEQEIRDYKHAIQMSCNVTLDDNSSYCHSFQISDCIIADYTSIVIEFFLSGRPVIYLGRVDNIERNISSSFYLSDSFQSICGNIDELSKGNDTKAMNRNDVLQNGLYESGAGARIIDTLLN